MADLPIIPLKDPYSDGTPASGRPAMSPILNWSDVGSTGLRQFGGWVREEFLRALQGREAARVFREMRDNSATVGALIFAIEQSLRELDWHAVAAGDGPKKRKAAEFADSLMGDLSTSWDEFIVEALSLLTFGFAPMEIVYKRRNGRKPPYRGTSADQQADDAGSKHNDGLIGIRRMPLRGQETILKWFFDVNGQITGLQQQAWVGPLIDIPIEKFLLFRPTHYKNNPEGRSILRNSYRAYFFSKRVEEEEAILFERLNGLPILKVPNWLLEGAAAGNVESVMSLENYKKIVTNTRIHEQMGLILPSDMWPGASGPSNQPMYHFELLTPSGSHGAIDPEKVLGRYSLDILKTCMADFIDLGHQARGTQNLAISKVDMFFNAIRGWVEGMAAVLNRYLLPRVWYLNGFPEDTMPEYATDLAQRIDLNEISQFVLRLSQAGARLFPDTALENYLRQSAGMPDVDDEADFSNTPTGVPVPDHRFPGDVGASAVPGEETGNETDGPPPTSEAVAKFIVDQVIRKRRHEDGPVVRTKDATSGSRSKLAPPTGPRDTRNRAFERPDGDGNDDADDGLSRATVTG